VSEVEIRNLAEASKTSETAVTSLFTTAFFLRERVRLKLEKWQKSAKCLKLLLNNTFE